MNWIIDYIGKPWINATQDCWWLVRDVYKKQLAIDLPLYDVDANSMRHVIAAMADKDNHPDWQQINKPSHLCLVFFMSSRNHPTHVAIYLDVDGGRYLHTCQRTGCICEPLFSAERHGWRSPLYYKHRLNK